VDPQPESDWGEWTDVEPDGDEETTIIAVELSGQPRLKVKPPPIYMYTQPDAPIEIEDEPATP